MKRIVALYGHAECGKSRTMNILRGLIRENGKSISSNPPYSGEQRETFLFNGQVVCLCPGVGGTGHCPVRDFQLWSV